MNHKYEIGQKVIIRSNTNQSLSLRDCTIEPYAGQLGQVTDYYWITPSANAVFYIYNVRVDEVSKDIALYEDEIEAIVD